MSETFFEKCMVETFDIKVMLKPNSRLMIQGKLCIWELNDDGLKALEVRDWSADAGPMCNIPKIPIGGER